MIVSPSVAPEVHFWTLLLFESNTKTFPSKSSATALGSLNWFNALPPPLPPATTPPSIASGAHFIILWLPLSVTYILPSLSTMNDWALLNWFGASPRSYPSPATFTLLFISESFAAIFHTDLPSPSNQYIKLLLSIKTSLGSHKSVNTVWPSLAPGNHFWILPFALSAI